MTTIHTNALEQLALTKWQTFTRRIRKKGRAAGYR